MENKTPKEKIALLAIFILIVAILGALAFLVYSGRGGAVGEKVKTFLPFGSGGEPREGGEIIPPDTTGGGIIEGSPAEKILKKLHNAPVAGLYPFTRTQQGQKTSTSTLDTIVRYIERGLGHIYETNMTTPEEEIRISNETRLKIYEAPGWIITKLFFSNFLFLISFSAASRLVFDISSAKLTLPVKPNSRTTDNALSV